MLLWFSNAPRIAYTFQPHHHLKMSLPRDLRLCHRPSRDRQFSQNLDSHSFLQLRKFWVAPTFRQQAIDLGRDSEQVKMEYKRCKIDHLTCGTSKISFFFHSAMRSKPKTANGTEVVMPAWSSLLVSRTLPPDDRCNSLSRTTSLTYNKPRRTNPRLSTEFAYPKSTTSTMIP